jgi:hypothetical protein
LPFIRQYDRAKKDQYNDMNMLFYDISSYETKNKVGGCCPEGHITDPWKKKMEEMSRRQRRMEASFQGGQDPDGTVAL